MSAEAALRRVDSDSLDRVGVRPPSHQPLLWSLSRLRSEGGPSTGTEIAEVRPVWSPPSRRETVP